MKRTSTGRFKKGGGSKVRRKSPARRNGRTGARMARLLRTRVR